ncbi:hypothetical protein PFICI_05444 [Pestalotiopsis fici W106-1]|uniref:Uncharacterized protein n=1 Tax=Pestalotiopsis fici (strain W106-1 / CGMCC3.15140) TaxID=1229662 RepID=W3XBV4_PESFW|nr:uncharacterized protein PFICI_05444 [Pestalotiopsis fici W106-1]ETS83568.1 hypothetical protein PFICI_05444 [Pestalotiopsis fici W106-1]
MENVYALSGAVPMRFTDLTTHTRRQMRDYLTTWGRHHMQNMGPISLRKLEEVVDELIFDAWTGGDKITEPKMDWPKITEIYVAVGIFKKDLPDPNRARSLFETDYLAELLTYLGLRERYTPHESRKAGKTACVRARLDKSQDAVILDWLDVRGKWVPYTYIDFQTPDNKPSNAIIAQACRQSTQRNGIPREHTKFVAFPRFAGILYTFSFL